jgi:phosphoserine phosphatase
MTREYPRIVFLDMEGTLLLKDYRFDDGRVAPSAWTVLAAKLGKKCLDAENRTKERWRAKKYSGYLEWMRKTIELHDKFGLTQQVFLEVVNSIAFVPNVEPAVRRLHARRAITAVVTGGFKALADRVQRRLRIHHSFAACEYFFHAQTGLIDHFNLLPADEVGKVDFMKLTCREYGVDPAECAFVGDGMNDVHLAQAVGFSIAFNAQPELCDVATETVSQAPGAEDFMAVAEVLESRFPARSKKKLKKRVVKRVRRVRTSTVSKRARRQ